MPATTPDGMSSWLLRRVDGCDEWVVFDRPAGSERDLVVLSETLGAMVVQRHPAGIVRVVGRVGVFRWDGRVWQHQPLVSAWVDTVGACAKFGDREVLQTLLEFAVHDLGARGIGATLVYRPDARLASSFDERLAAPPPLRVMRPADLAPLRHILSQTDGAALFDDTGVLTQIGVRLVPSARAELEVVRVARHAAHLGAPLQLRRPLGDRDRGERGRPGDRAAPRRHPRRQRPRRRLISPAPPTDGRQHDRAVMLAPIGCVIGWRGPRLLHGASKPRTARIVRIAGVCSSEHARSPSREVPVMKILFCHAARLRPRVPAAPARPRCTRRRP